MHRKLPLLALLFSLTLLAQTPAQTPPDNGMPARHRADLLELKSFTLSMDIVTRLAHATEAINRIALTDPALKAIVDKLNNIGDQTFADMTALVQSSPRMVAIVKAHGFTPHGYCVAMFALYQTALISASLPSDTPRAQILAVPGLNPANYDFLRKHRAEVEALQKRSPPAPHS
jgi:hypothetical protein